MSIETPLKREDSEYRRKLTGVIDMQIHLAPDIVQRSSSDGTFAKHAERAGYYGWLSKCHHLTTAGRGLVLPKPEKVRFFGSIALNNSMGGLNPYAVEVALKLGASEVWFPTLDADNHIKAFGQATLPTFTQLDSKSSRPALQSKPISVLDEKGDLNSQARSVIETMVGSEVILGTGHLALVEAQKVIEYAKQHGHHNILITHPEFRATFFSKEDQKVFADQGAYLEHCATVNYDARLIAENIRHVGSAHCILSSDSGQPLKGNPVDTFYEFIVALEDQGVSMSDIQKMTIDNPKKMLRV